MNQAGMNQAGRNQNVAESLSAGVDGELSREQLRFLLRQLDHDPSLQQAWASYHMARDGLRQQLPPLASAGFAARVMLAIEQESLVAAKPAATTRRGHWLRWSAGGAIAASVAAAALMIGQPTGDGERMVASAVPQNAVVATASPASKPTTAPAAVPPWLSNSSAGLLSQQASATLGEPFGQLQSTYARPSAVYPGMPRYRTLDNNDGSYLLLLNPVSSGGPDGGARRASVAAH